MNSVTEALKTKAYVAPFAVFMGFTLVWQFGVPLLEWDHPAAPWWRRAPEQWLYPVQAIVCFALVFRWRKAIDWDWRWKPAAWGILFGVLGILCWLAPTMIADRLPGGADAWFGHPSWPWYRYLLGIDARPDGFDPGVVFLADSWRWLGALVLRFFRAVAVVALVEELVWRGYLMRILGDYPLFHGGTPACGLLRRIRLRFLGVSACRLAEKPVRCDHDACGGECVAGMGRSGMG